MSFTLVAMALALQDVPDDVVVEDQAHYGARLARSQSLSLGDSWTFHEPWESRQVNVILPSRFSNELVKPVELNKRYPVIYLLDGGTTQDLMLGTGIARWNVLWGRSEEAIIVGIETKDRQRELLPPTDDAAEQDRYPSAGSQYVFRRYLEQRVMPMIEKNYPTDGRSFLVGESAAGHFVVQTWREKPDLFDGYAAISPSLQWDSEGLSKDFAEKPGGERPPLYLSLADEGGATESGMMRLLDALPEEQPYCFSDRREDLRHATSLHGLLPEALQYLMPTEADWLDEYGLTLRCERGGRETVAAAEAE